MIWNFSGLWEAYPSAYGQDDDFNGPMPLYGVNLARGLMEYSDQRSVFPCRVNDEGGTIHQIEEQTGQSSRAPQEALLGACIKAVA